MVDLEKHYLSNILPKNENDEDDYLFNRNTNNFQNSINNQNISIIQPKTNLIPINTSSRIKNMAIPESNSFFETSNEQDNFILTNE